MKRRFLWTLLFVFVGACAVSGGVQSLDHATPEPQAAAVALSECQVVGTLDNGNLLMECPAFPAEEQPTLEPWTATPALTDTPVAYPPPDTDTPAPTVTIVPTDTATPTIVPSLTPAPPTATAAPSTPYPAAPLCADSGANHDVSQFHTLWDAGRGCHFDHEHGTNPFTPEVGATFPGFDLLGLLGAEIGHTNPSGPMENTHKHGGFKWDVNLSVPCEVFESAQNCVTAAVVQYHAFGDYAVEMESRIHSTAALVRVGNAGNYGYLYTVQHQEYGQRITPYQGTLLAYPDNFQPTYDTPRGPYFTIDCIHPTAIQCRRTLGGSANSNSIWTSKPTGQGARPPGSTLFRLLFRVRDTYQYLDFSDLVYPFTFRWRCGDAAYNPVGCKYNNTTTRVHEIAGTIPAAWDSLDGLADGRVTYTGYTSRFGVLDTACTAPGPDCHPVKLVNMPVGTYGGPLPGAKVSNPSPVSNPSRNIYFCAGLPCAATAAGAVPSGWVGPSN